MQEVEGSKHTLQVLFLWKLTLRGEVRLTRNLFQIASSLGDAAMGIFSCDATTNLGSVVETTRVTGIVLGPQKIKNCYICHSNSSGAQCNDPRPLDRSLELVFSDLEDATVKVELCSNGEITLFCKACSTNNRLCLKNDLCR